ncbi:hypothetical protein J6590_003449 [Homalodisca vitripennis]|nr:hypothetical protein J6590_003449 [Homalodisca vitripennis]
MGTKPSGEYEKNQRDCGKRTMALATENFNSYRVQHNHTVQVATYYTRPPLHGNYAQAHRYEDMNMNAGKQTYPRSSRGPVSVSSSVFGLPTPLSSDIATQLNPFLLEPLHFLPSWRIE